MSVVKCIIAQGICASILGGLYYPAVLTSGLVWGWLNPLEQKFQEVVLGCTVPFYLCYETGKAAGQSTPSWQKAVAVLRWLHSLNYESLFGKALSLGRCLLFQDNMTYPD